MSTLTLKSRIIHLHWLRLALVALTLAGIGVSAYLMWGYTVPGATLSCGASSGCEAVKNSEYARLAGIPLPVLGLGVYLALLVLLLVQGYAVLRHKNGYIALAIFGISLAGVLYSAYLTYLELFVIYAICRWCVASAVIMVAIFLLSIFNLRNTESYYSTEG
ncbi:MAG: vitamin K epoxide reductase family protein [Anaerolineae bacterium]